MIEIPSSKEEKKIISPNSSPSRFAGVPPLPLLPSPQGDKEKGERIEIIAKMLLVMILQY